MIQKYEHTRVRLNKIGNPPYYHYDRSLNEMGDSGWELVSIIPERDGQYADMGIFKRPVVKEEE